LKNVEFWIKAINEEESHEKALSLFADVNIFCTREQVVQVLGEVRDRLVEASTWTPF
tara:strand:- start:108 stop:278 length:171 start_codon:yes stop_codon:yes gene_type:complete